MPGRHGVIPGGHHLLLLGHGQEGRGEGVWSCGLEGGGEGYGHVTWKEEMRGVVM